MQHHSASPRISPNLKPLAAYEAQLLARSRELIARSRELLRRHPPTTFLGEPRQTDPTRRDDLSKRAG